MRLLISMLTVTLAGGCASAPQPIPPPDPHVPVVPLDYATNLETFQRCDYRGPVSNVFQAASLEANVVVVFVAFSETYSHNGVTTRNFGWTRGKAVRCPPDLVQKYRRAAIVVEGAR